MEAAYRVLRSNLRNNLYNGIAWSIGFNFVTPFIGIIAAHLGASNTDYALLSSVPALLTILATLPASIVMGRFRRQKRIAGAILFASRLCYLLLALLPLFHFRQLILLIVLVGVYNATNTIIAVSYQSMVGEIIPVKYRNRVFAVRNIWVSVSGMFAALAAGWGIDKLPYPYGYQAAYTIGFLAAMAELYYFMRLRVPSEETGEASGGVRKPVSFAYGIRLLFRGFNPGTKTAGSAKFQAGRPFYLFCASAVVFIFAWQAAWPIYLKVKVDTLHATNSMMSFNAVAGSLGSLLGFRPWARFADWKGNGLTVFGSALLLALTPLQWMYAPSMLWVSMYDFMGGLITAGFTQSVFNRLLEIVPPQAKQRAIAVYTSLSQVSAVFAPLVGMKIYEHFPLWLTMLIISCVRVAGALCFLLILAQRLQLGVKKRSGSSKTVEAADRQI